jgi:hypothetical protein
MSYDHFRPPEHFSPMGKVLFRLLCLATVVIVMSAFAYFVAPLINEYVGVPFGNWVGNLIFGPAPQ